MFVMFCLQWACNVAKKPSDQRTKKTINMVVEIQDEIHYLGIRIVGKFYFNFEPNSVL